MITLPFMVGEVIKEGWRLTKANLGYLIAYQIIMIALFLLFSGSYHGLAGLIWEIIGWAVFILVKMGLYNSALLITKKTKPEFEQLYQNWPSFLSWVIASILFSIMFAIGLALLIVPGCYILAMYGFFPFFILDKGVGPLDALKESARATKGIRGLVFLLFLACFGLDLLGLLFFGVGLLLTIPVTLLALTVAYRRIAKRVDIVG